MSRFKSGFAVLLLTAIVGVAPQAHAAPVLKVMMVGASGTWQALAVGAYKGGACPDNQTAGNCAHYSSPSSGGNFNLNDSRPTLGGLGGSTVTDAGSLWIVWDHHASDVNCNNCNVWAYIKVDSIVGNRCYFAKPHCKVQVTTFPAKGVDLAHQTITLPAPAWGLDTGVPATIKALFTTGTATNVAVSEIRPEDALLGQCRINSVAGGGSDSLDGLGLGANTPAGSCPSFGDPLANLLGTDLTSTYPSSTSTAHPVAFNISGNDPFTNSAIPTFATAVLGAEPLIFVTARASTNPGGHLSAVTNATLAQLQTMFSGADCSGDVLDNGTAGDTDVYLREPLSGTMNTAEYTAFRLPLGSGGSYAGLSQEDNLTAGQRVAVNVACAGGAGHGKRRSGIGTGEEVKFIQHSNDTLGTDVIDQRDGIGYTFFSYGNVNSIAGNANYGYLTINGIDPLFQIYGISGYDDGESTIAGALPKIADVAACSGAFPCHEKNIWKGGLSFPNVRNGSYRQWAVVRLIADSGSQTFTDASALVASAQASAVTTVPDFIPSASVTAGTFTDPGLLLFRSHYTQKGVAPFNNQNQGGTTDKGGEEGGCIVSKGSTATKLVQRATGCVQGN